MKKTLITIFICIIILMGNSIAIDFDAEKIYESVFVISSGEAVGSGFAIGKDCIISNAHVIDNKDSINIIGYNGNYYKANVVAQDKKQEGDLP